MISSYIHRFWRLEPSIFGWASLKILPTTGILIDHSMGARKAIQPVKIQVTVVWEQQEVVITGTHLTMVYLPYHLMFLFSPSSRRLRMSRNCYGQKLRKSGKIFIVIVENEEVHRLGKHRFAKHLEVGHQEFSLFKRLTKWFRVSEISVYSVCHRYQITFLDA